MTPDSFSDGGAFAGAAAAVQREAENEAALNDALAKLAEAAGMGVLGTKV